MVEVLGNSVAPLAVRMRPRTLADLVGQSSALQPGAPLRRLLEGDEKAAVSVILWGPPGTGKTTLASLVAGAGGRNFVELSAVNAGVKDVREVIERASSDLGRGTVLFIDEVHRFNKTQQDALLPAVENGVVTLVAATTENPSFSVNAPLLSRSVIVRLQSLTDSEVEELLLRAISAPHGLADSVTPSADALEAIIRLTGGDARAALTLLDAAAGVCGSLDKTELTLSEVQTAAQKAIAIYDRAGDAHYDITSAFIKSMRGSDVDAALHYLARMISAGEDPRFIARRIVILASEDIGMADPSALQTAVAAMQAVAQIGMPEAGLTLAQAVVHCALAPKSNSVTLALGRAIADVEAGRSGVVPPHLRDSHYSGARKLGHGLDYEYPHDYAAGVVAQQYLPDALANRKYFEPTQHGAEARWGLVLEQLRTALRSESVGSPTDSSA